MERAGRGARSLAPGGPLIVSTASLTVMMFVDRMFLCWISEKAVAAVLPAGMTYYALVCLPLGVASYVNTFVARLDLRPLGAAVRWASKGPRGDRQAQWFRAAVYLVLLMLMTVFRPRWPKCYLIPNPHPPWKFPPGCPPPVL